MPGTSLAKLEQLTGRLLFSRPSCPSSTSSLRSNPPRLSRSCSKTSSRLFSRQTRNASTHASSTAINAQKEIPPRLAELHGALEGLKKDAATYTNISRLGLAIRSLESCKPTIRIALLGLRSTAEARKLARLLLADVLGDEGEWERQLQANGNGDQRGLLLRYGEAISSTSTTLLSTLLIPSRLLQQHNIEILISSLNISAGLPSGPIDTGELRRIAFVPTAEIQNTFRGGMSHITYPVHRAVVLAQGIQGCLALGRYATLNLDKDGSTGSALKLALNLPRSSNDRLPEMDRVQDITVLDLDRGVEAIDKFRESNANAVVYEQQWHRSGVSELSAWLAEGFPEGHEKDTNPAVTALISDLVTEASRNITIEEAERTQKLLQINLQESARQPLEEALSQWAMRAHSELRNDLEAAFGSKQWARLRWLKLLWRVDDVSMTVSELLARHWLVDAEKGIIWLSGRSVEAGFQVFTPQLELSIPDIETQAAETRPETRPETTSQISVPSTEAANALLQQSWPTLIPGARLALSQSTVPALQATAQALLVQTITITGATAGLAGILYLALPTASVYSTGAIAALGLVWSLRLLQRKWEHIRASFESEVRESARVTLKQMEESFRAMLLLPRAAKDDASVLDRAKAKQAVQKVKTSLDKLLR